MKAVGFKPLGPMWPEMLTQSSSGEEKRNSGITENLVSGITNTTGLDVCVGVACCCCLFVCLFVCLVVVLLLLLLLLVLFSPLTSSAMEKLPSETEIRRHSSWVSCLTRRGTKQHKASCHTPRESLKCFGQKIYQIVPPAWTKWIHLPLSMQNA